MGIAKVHNVQAHCALHRHAMSSEFFSRDAPCGASMHASPSTLAVDPLAASRSFEPWTELCIRLCAIAFLIVVNGDVHP